MNLPHASMQDVIRSLVANLVNLFLGRIVQNTAENEAIL